ncbi:RNA-binding S4 domain-containing protein [Rhodoferax sp. PAMC 29310]|uniref:RNA-binding S4 domain-containing protein n=1 Tax=Rhodoferax sp. PAMC 29310 TaxID=2822760 RepID=UPI001B31E422|nr:RNA-binding S4 domain-containing protein [Rhodoferax sp. PAMC 29310]
MEKLRIDKWLWVSRFYKTRSLAADEVDKGRVSVNGTTVKPAKELKIGDAIEIQIGAVSRRVIVAGLSDKRGSAPVAAQLFNETAESQAKRIAAAEQRRLAPEPALSLAQGRPTKRDRRTLEKAKGWQAPE